MHHQIDIFSFDLLMIPIFHCSHWTIAYVDNQNRTISYYDSLRLGDKGVCRRVLEYLSEEHLDKKGKPLPHTYTILNGDFGDTQHNGFDCGVHVCKSARSFVDDQWATKSIAAIRRQMMEELKAGGLIQQ